MNRASVLVVGGGIGGLAAALAGARAGVPVQLFERNPAFAEVGAGIQLGPNVTRILHGWGLQKELEAVAAYPDQLVIRSADTAAVLGALSLGAQAKARYGAPYATVHRADLHGLLLQKVQATTDAALHLGQPITGFEQDETGVCLHHADGRQSSGALLVGADGLWSRVRQQLLGDGAPRLTGQQAYRALLPVVGESRQPRTCMSVDFPLPEGPMIEMNSPPSMSRSTSSSARISSPPRW